MSLVLLEIFYFFLGALLIYWQQNIEIYCSPQWGAADAEIKVPSGENKEFKRSPFKA